MKKKQNNTEPPRKRVISVFANVRDNMPSHQAVDFSDLVELTSVHEIRETKDGPAISGAEFKPNTPRKNANVIRVNFVILDVDKGDVDEFTANCKKLGWSAILYSTFSHVTGKDCFRAVFQPSRPVSPAEWPTVWNSMNTLLGSAADKATRDLSHIFYMPSHPKAGRADAFVSVLEGDKPVDVDALLALPVLETARKIAQKKASSKASSEMSCRAIADEFREDFQGGLWYYNENFREYADGYWRKLNQRIDLAKVMLEKYADLSAAGANEAIETLKITCAEQADQAFSHLDKAGKEAIRRLICLKNGTLDPVTSALLPHSPEHRRLCGLNIEWDPTATSPRFLQFLSEIWGFESDYRERVEFLQEWMGYLLLPSNKFERFLWLTGFGANGKSVLLTIMSLLVGLENTTWAHLDRLNRTAVRATLEGKMLNISTEMNADGTLADGHLKSITSGEPVDAEPKYKDPYSFIPTVKLVAATNHLPRLKDTSGGFARRACILTFNKVFTVEERDVNLSATLEAELLGILVWALDGLARLLERGHFVPPPSSDATVQAYRIEADSVAMFNHERLEPSSNGTPVGTLYEAYREFCTTNGFQPTNVAIFGRRLTESGVETLRKSRGKPIRAAALRVDPPVDESPTAARMVGNVVAIPRKGTKVTADELFDDIAPNGTEN